MTSANTTLRPKYKRQELHNFVIEHRTRSTEKCSRAFAHSRIGSLRCFDVFLFIFNSSPTMPIAASGFSFTHIGRVVERSNGRTAFDWSLPMGLTWDCINIDFSSSSWNTIVREMSYGRRPFTNWTIFQTETQFSHMIISRNWLQWICEGDLRAPNADWCHSKANTPDCAFR